VDVVLPPGRSHENQVPSGWSGLIYVLEGQVTLGHAVIRRGSAAILAGGGDVRVTAAVAARFALIVGEPLGEPIRQRGSFVA
jgi:hypothetical protein